MSTKLNPGAFDCYANARPNEEMFILLGRDRSAAALVRLWAMVRIRQGDDTAQIKEALDCADRLERECRERWGKDPLSVNEVTDPHHRGVRVVDARLRDLAEALTRHQDLCMRTTGRFDASAISAAILNMLDTPRADPLLPGLRAALQTLLDEGFDDNGVLVPKFRAPQSIIDRLQHMIDVAGKTGAAIDTRLLQDLIHDDNVDGGSLFETRRGG